MNSKTVKTKSLSWPKPMCGERFGTKSLPCYTQVCATHWWWYEIPLHCEVLGDNEMRGTVHRPSIIIFILYSNELIIITFWTLEGPCWVCRMQGAPSPHPAPPHCPGSQSPRLEPYTPDQPTTSKKTWYRHQKNSTKPLETSQNPPFSCKTMQTYSNKVINTIENPSQCIQLFIVQVVFTFAHVAVN